jgi:hypothetical protein
MTTYSLVYMNSLIDIFRHSALFIQHTLVLHFLLTQCHLFRASLPVYCTVLQDIFLHFVFSMERPVGFCEQGAETVNTDHVNFTLGPTKAVHRLTLTEGQTGKARWDPTKTSVMTKRGCHRVERNSDFLLRHVTVCQGTTSDVPCVCRRLIGAHTHTLQ